MKKIVALSCGRKNRFTESLIKEAAMGAEEFGIETEIIRAMSCKVLPCRGCDHLCMQSGKCWQKDDVEWILQKTCVEDAALIVGVPCYHVRANGFFACIHERLNHVFINNWEIMKKTRVGAIIGIGGGGYDSWTSLNLPMVDIFVQHTRKVVDRMQVNFCALKEWNLWERTDMTPVTQKVRITDIPYEDMWTVFGPQDDRLEFYRKALSRARELGRNVARAMNMPIEDVKYVGEKSGVECPVCHANILHIHEDLPYVMCPTCAVRGEIVIENGKMRVQWNEADARVPRFSLEGDQHHVDWLGKHYFRNPQYFAAAAEMTKAHAMYGKIIRPETSQEEDDQPEPR
jgi:multimeric flavodoxin WrbA